jgi:cation:H+ antiporter
MEDLLVSVPVPANFALFFACAVGVWYAGARLAYLADEVSDRLKLAKSMVGLLVLALVTSLPEVVTTLSAAISQNADLVLNNLFGGIALQTAILAVGDFWARGAITNYPKKSSHALEATLLIGLLACIQAAFVLKGPVAVMNVGFGSLIVGLVYIGAVLLLRHYDGNNDWLPIDLPSIDSPVQPQSDRALIAVENTRRLVFLGIAASAAILILGTGLVVSAEAIAVQTGLGSSFIGVTLLAAATSLPELSTTVTAVRLGAYTMAISNIFGSNLIMIVLVLPADMLYESGPILKAGNFSAQLAVALGVLLTAVYLVGLIIRRKPTLGRIGADSAVVLAIYFASLFLFYQVR